MKRLHVHVAVADLEASIRFYSALFAAEPTSVKGDYAKWMLDDPRVNFAISTRSPVKGLNHLGMQVESAEELAEMHARLEPLQAVPESQTSCCYAKSDKYWVNDPQGVAWETFHTLADIPVWGKSVVSDAVQAAQGARSGPAAEACCGADTNAQAVVRDCC